MAKLDNAEWRVGVDPDLPEMVYLKVSELCDSGVKVIDIYLLPKDAELLAAALRDFASDIRFSR